MRLCFGSFAEILYKYRKNNSVSREHIGRTLLDFIDPSFAEGKEASYIYRFMNRKRELPVELKRQGFDLAGLQASFSLFADENLNTNHKGLMDAFVELVTEDDILAMTHKRNFCIKRKPSASPCSWPRYSLSSC